MPEGYDPLALVGKFTPIEDIIGLLETTFEEDDVLMGVFLDEVIGSVALIFLVLFIGVTAIILLPKSLLQGKYQVDEKDRIEVTAVDLKLLLSGILLMLIRSDIGFSDCSYYSIRFDGQPNHLCFVYQAFLGFSSIKKSNDAVKLQALIDRKNVIITKDTIRQSLRLDDVDGRKFNFSKYIFDNMVRNMDSPSKFLMYLRFLQVMINAQVDDLSSHNTKYTSPARIQKVFANMRRIGKGFSAIYIPLFDAMLVQQHVQDDAEVEKDEDDNEVSAASAPPSSTPATAPPPPQQEPIPSPPQAQSAQPSSPPQQQPSQTADISESSMTLLNTLKETCATLTQKVANLEQDKIAQALKITKLKMVESQAKAYNLDLQHSEKILSMQDTDETEPAKVEEVLEVVTAAKLMIEVVTTAAPITTATQVPKASAPRRRRGVVIQDPEETTSALVIMHSEARKNMMIYLKNMAGFKMNFFKDMTYTEIRPIFEKHYNSNQAFLERVEEEVTVQEKKIKEEWGKRKGKSLEQKIAKKQKMDKEAKELKRHLQIVANNDDDVYIEAAPIVSKVPIVDYQIHHENIKPYYKIIRSDRTHKLFLSFITLLKNFNREDLETLYKLVKERFESTEPKNFLDDFLLNIFKIMFEKPNVEANLFLLVEKKYPLTHFTLEQMLNNVRLEVEEESEMSLELLSFGVDAVQDFKKMH
uniref:Synaptobrevin, longin-like domain protein n=1 Tax=Tanacetum cinerariifolium TaxID=118510 RepID=A0A6L2J9Z2_TANCI|nr:hypothetical protein [Tanacetum cinerariifolium]